MPRGRKKQLRPVFKINKHIYITCDKRNWMLFENDIPILFAPNLDEIIHIMVNHKIRTTEEINNIAEAINNIHKLVDMRITKGIKPKNLFELGELNDGA